MLHVSIIMWCFLYHCYVRHMRRIWDRLAWIKARVIMHRANGQKTRLWHVALESPQHHQWGRFLDHQETTWIMTFLLRHYSVWREYKGLPVGCFGGALNQYQWCTNHGVGEQALEELPRRTEGYVRDYYVGDLLLKGACWAIRDNSCQQARCLKRWRLVVLRSGIR